MPKHRDERHWLRYSSSSSQRSANPFGECDERFGPVAVDGVRIGGVPICLDQDRRCAAVVPWQR